MNRPEIEQAEREGLRRVHALRQQLEGQLSALEEVIKGRTSADRVGSFRDVRAALQNGAESIDVLAQLLAVKLPPSRATLARHVQECERAVAEAGRRFEEVIMENAPARTVFEAQGRARMSLEAARAALAAHDRKVAGCAP